MHVCQSVCMHANMHVHMYEIIHKSVFIDCICRLPNVYRVQQVPPNIVIFSTADGFGPQPLGVEEANLKGESGHLSAGQREIRSPSCSETYVMIRWISSRHFTFNAAQGERFGS